MDFKHHLEIAWNLTLKHIVVLIVMTLVTLTVSAFTLGILAPVCFAGYMQSILLLVRGGREPRLQDVFSEMALFVPLFGFYIAVLLILSIGFLFFIIPGVVLAVALTYLLLYMLPLMTDKRMGVVDAAKKSVEITTKGNLQDHIIVAVIFIGITSLGGSFLIVSLVAQPFATIFLMSVYENLFGDRATDMARANAADDLKQK